jgi:hypothetical protein
LEHHRLGVDKGIEAGVHRHRHADARRHISARWHPRCQHALLRRARVALCCRHLARVWVAAAGHSEASQVLSPDGVCNRVCRWRSAGQQGRGGATPRGLAVWRQQLKTGGGGLQGGQGRVAEVGHWI